MVRAIMHGCNGKMGRVITGLIWDDDAIEIVAGIDTYTGTANDYPVFESIEACDVEADVVIDFSNASAVDHLLDYCAKKKLPVVLCTTGLSEEQLRKVEETAEQTAVLKSANMSLGINLLLKLLQNAAKVLGPAGFDIELVERHHNQKVDAPSGTALALADSVNEALDNQYTYVFDRSQDDQIVFLDKLFHQIRIGCADRHFSFGEMPVLVAGHQRTVQRFDNIAVLSLCS